LDIKNKLKDIVQKNRELLGKINKKTKRLIILGGVLLVLFAIGAAVYLNTRPYAVLFTEVNEQESREIIGKLQEYGVDYKYQNNGTILVPNEQAEKLRAQLAFEGYPKSGFTYDVFKDNISLTTTDTEKQQYLLFDLQNRIGATISLFDGVKDAKVTIALGEDSRYVLDNNKKTDATASVVVIMKDGGSPSEEQVKGIQRLVARSIPKLNFENIAVLDGNGNDVTVSGEESLSTANALKLQVEREIEKSIKNNVLQIVSPIYGMENVKVSVKCSVDIDKKLREIVNYSAPPNEEEKRGIPGTQSSTQEVIRGGEGQTGGTPGMETNADIPIYGQVETNGTETYIRNQNDITYLVNQIKEQAQVDAGTLQDLTISVVVNGEDLGGLSRNQLIELIAKASGISPDMQNQKIAVASVPFYTEKADVPAVVTGIRAYLDDWMIIALAAGFALLLLIIIIVVIVVRKKKKKKKALAEALAAAAPADEQIASELLEQGVEIPENLKEKITPDLLNIQNERGMELKENIRKFAEENPEIAAQIIKSWLKGGESIG
jgi:flagellar M-ring protein FliF